MAGLESMVGEVSFDSVSTEVQGVAGWRRATAKREEVVGRSGQGGIA